MPSFKLIRSEPTFQGRTFKLRRDTVTMPNGRETKLDIAGVDDAHHRAEQLREIGGAADLLQHAGMLEFGFQGDRIRQLAGFDAPDDRLEDAAMDRIGEMLRREELGNPLIGAVVGEQRAEQRLLRLHVGGRQALRHTE